MDKVKRCQAQLRVQIRSLPTPDADSRITRAISILLIAAARHADLSEENTKPEKENNLTRDSAGGPN
jgi:hypothetical protein